MPTKNIISDTVKHLPLITKILLMLVTAALIPLMFPSEGKGTHYDYAEGSIWRDSDLVAPHDFAVQRSQSEVERDVAEAKNNLLLYYHYDNTAYNRALERLNSLSSSLPDSRVRHMRNSIDSIYRVGFLEMPDDIPNFKRHDIIILEGNVGSQHYVSQYITPLDVRDSLLRERVLVPSIAYDQNRTQLELDSRLSQLATTNGMVRQGELIIAKGEQVSPEKAQIIRSLEQENDRRYQQNYHPWGRYIGQFALCLFALVALFLFMRNTRHPILEDTHKVTFIMVLILIMSAATAMVLYVNADWVLIVPLCIVPIIMRVFFDMRVALYVHVTTIIILANMVPNPFEFIFYQLIAGMMTIVTVRNFEDRSKFFLVAGVIFLSYALIYTFGVLSQESTLESITWNRYLIFFLNALLSLLAYPLIYLFERLFGLTTNLTLMELSSTNTPALRELSRNAAGTFQHSMQVANISEDLINEIGGNSLLAKVGALYHDIGKLQAPLYFTENQNSEFNPHDELDNIESASIIISHVSDGIQLARQYHLPTAVQDFIRTHHGTTVTGYFYAKEKAAHPGEEISVADFRYNGPTPFSRETAVVMMVDSVEAACKSLKNHDKEAIDKLVDGIIDSKIKQNQLQNCDLTFGDITRIRKILKSRMMSIYHSRISYEVKSKN
ncbi:MAG: HDIG domain-containing protein [Bacteroidales bacterium]|nr:HDIG domain-containing protein [Bacteroidales bacterium]